MARQRWKLTRNGEIDTWGERPRNGERSVLAEMARDEASGLHEIEPGLYASRPGERVEDGSISF